MVTKNDIVIDESEMQEAEAQAEGSSGTFTHVLKNPFSYEGKELVELHFDWEKLTGRDCLAIERELQAIGRPVVVRELSGDYQIRVAVKACREKISVDFLTALPMKDCIKILNATRSFLLAAE